MDDLPEGTFAIETPSREILYVSDAQDGVLVFEIAEDDVNTGDIIEIIPLNDEMIPLGSAYISVLDENGEIADGNHSPSGWMIVLCIVIGLIILAAVLLVDTPEKRRFAL